MLAEGDRPLALLTSPPAATPEEKISAPLDLRPFFTIDHHLKAMGFFSKKPKAPPPKPIAYLDIMRAPENSFFIALRTDSGAPPDHNDDPDTSPLEDTEAEHGSAGIGTHKGVPSAPTLPPTQADEPHLQDSAFSPMSATKNPPFYSTSIHKKKLKKDTAGIWHGMPASGTLFAEIKGQKIQFHGSMESIIRRRQLLSRTWVFGQCVSAAPPVV